MPDSTLNSFISLLQSKTKINHEVAVNEGSAVAMGIGYNLATNKIPLVYFQNSGLGHAMNPITSMADKNIFSIPMLILIGWRGKPGFKDEPQHKVIGPKLLKVLSSIKLKTFILKSTNYKKKINEALNFIRKNSSPACIVVDKFFFEKINIKKNFNSFKKKRINFIKALLNNKRKNDIFIGSTGYISRELFYLNEKFKLGHKSSFYCIGAMGHANQIGYAISKFKKKRVFILDGDGAIQMHTGNLFKISEKLNKNIYHIIFNNYIHESTGNHFVTNKFISYRKLFKSMNYKNSFEFKSVNTFKKFLKKNYSGPTGIELKVKVGTIKNLPRPHLSTFQQKKLFNI